jgi:hypothetical protein
MKPIFLLLCNAKTNLLLTHLISVRDGLWPKSLRGNRFYKGHRDIEEKASQHFKKASIPLKMYLKSFAIPAKVSIFL